MRDSVDVSPAAKSITIRRCMVDTLSLKGSLQH